MVRTGNRLAQKFVAHLNALHGEAIQHGLADTSPEYFQHLDERLAAMQEQQDEAAGQEMVEEMEKLAAANGRAETRAAAGSTAITSASHGQRAGQSLGANAVRQSLWQNYAYHSTTRACACRRRVRGRICEMAA